MSEQETAGRYQIENQHMVQGQVIGDHTTVHIYPAPVPSVHPSQPAASAPVWNVPFPEKKFFIGREALLKQLRTQLTTTQTAALGQTISGLGGIGKTQLAVKYAYRHRQEYQAVLWAHAETTESLTTSYTVIARLLQLPQKDTQDQGEIIQGVKDWLSHQQHWLLILDNADEPDVLIPFLPLQVGGHLIVTTRAADLSHLGLGFEHALTVPKFTKQQDVPFLLRRAGFQKVSRQERAYARRIADELDGLPLALNQAGVYLTATGSSLAAYWKLYQQRRKTMLSKQDDREYPRSVASTLLLSFGQVEQRNRAAADLLRLCAFLAPDAIPEELLNDGAKELGDTLSSLAEDAYQLNQAFADLRACSLLIRNPHTGTLSVHRLVQAVVRDSMTSEQQQQWEQHALLAINATFPASGYRTWFQCERLLPHALMIIRTIQQFPATSEAGRLLHETAFYLQDRARYQEAEPLYQRALALREQLLGPEHPDVALTLNGLGRLYYDQSNYQQAESLHQRALVIQERQLGPEHPEVARTLAYLARLLREQARYAEAEQLYQRMVRIQKQLGPEHLDVALTFHGLATFFHQQGQSSEAEQFYQQALPILEREKHPDRALVLNGLAILFHQQAQYAEAEQFYRRALPTLEQQLGPLHPKVAYLLSNLAASCIELGKYAEAEQHLLRALEICEQRLGPEHHGTAYPLSNLALLYQKQRRFTEAEQLSQRAVEICQKQVGLKHPDTIATLHDLAEIYRQQGKYEQAQQVYQQFLAISEEQLGKEHPHTQDIQQWYIALLREMEQREKEQDS